VTIRWKYLMIFIVLLPIVGIGFAWSGLMSVKASTGHWPITDWFLHWVMKNSIRTDALFTDVPPLSKWPAAAAAGLERGRVYLERPAALRNRQTRGPFYRHARLADTNAR
jgi:hypothetical protein